MEHAISSTIAAGTSQLERATSLSRQQMGEQAVRDFESILLHRLLQEMRLTIPDSPLAEDASSEQFQDLFWMYLAQDLANKGGLGLCRDLYSQVSQPAAGQVELLR